MKKKTNMKKVLMTTVLVTVGILTIGGTNSQAALQANSTTHNKPKTATGASWIQSIREMETTGQTMGLNEKLKTDLTTDGESNNVDVHMMRTTEFGAIAILSVSGFGNPNKLQDSTIKSTTGNVTGVYIKETEWTAGVCSTSTVGKNARYYDLYTTDQTSAKVGDALGLDTYTDNPGCSRWHGSGGTWLEGTQCGFKRGGVAMFNFTGEVSYLFAVWATRSDPCRGVAVIGQGL